MKTIILLVLLGAVGLTALTGSEPAPALARERLAGLRAEIAHHDELYFKKAAPEITDAQYDSLKRELRALETEFPDLAAAPGPGDDRTGEFPTHRHRAPMLGLNKSHTEAELKGFITGLEKQTGRTDLLFVLEPKYDGLAISVTYEKGDLVRAVTRGNGLEGDEVTASLLACSEVPRRLAVGSGAPPDLIELRGEVYMTHAEFDRINREREAAGEEPFAHPRNLAVGTLKQRGGEGRRSLAVVFYGVGAVLPAAAMPPTQLALHVQIRSWGLPGVGEYQAVRTAGAVWHAVQAMGATRRKLSYPVDGAVVKLDDLRLQGELGSSAEAPRGAIAYKFPPEAVTTRVTGITLQIGRTGVLAPVAELEPVRIGGATIRRATLHNREQIARKDIRIGDYVFLEKAGEIIPTITGVDRGRRPAGAAAYVFPEDCPACAARLALEGMTVRCPNYDCRAQVPRRLEHFVSNGAADIDGLGRTLVESLTRQGLVRTPADLYRLTREQWLTVTTPRTADKLLAAVAASKKRERWRFIHGLGVPDIGPAGAKAIAQRFPDLSAWAGATAEDFQGSGINETVVRASLAFFARPGNREDVRALQRAVTPG